MSYDAKDRLVWVDILRGFAMVLVVFGHALIGVTSSLDETRLSRFLILLIYSVHMPVLFALAGGLSQRLMTRPLAAFLHELLRRIVWPYLLWGSLLLAVHFIMSAHTNTAVSVYRPLSILWAPPAVMWFLYVLFIAALMRRALNNARSVVTFTVAGICIFLPYVWDFPISNLRYVGVYLMASVLWPVCLGSNGWCVRSPMIIAALVVMFSGIVVLAWFDSAKAISGYPASAWTYLPALMVCPILAGITAQSLPTNLHQGQLAHLLSCISRHSMAVFVLHIFFTAGARILALNFGLTDLWVVTVLATVAGLIGPLWAAHLASKWRLGRVLGWQSA